MGGTRRGAARSGRKLVMLLALASAISAAVAGIARSSGVGAGSGEGAGEPSLSEEKAARLAVDSPSIPVDYAAWKKDYIESNATPVGSSFTPGPEDQYLLTGIIDGGQGPFSPDAFNMANGWQEIVDGTLIQVWAGSYGSKPDQGVVLVRHIADWQSPTERGNLTSSSYDAPAEAGALRIVDWSGTVLTITSSSGATYLFDATQGELRPR